MNVELNTTVASLAHELEEAREQQAATSEVLRIIAISRTDPQPVFQAIVRSAARLCSSEFSFIDTFDGELLHFVAHYGLTPGAAEAASRVFPMPPGRGSAVARAIETRVVAQTPDIRMDPSYEGSAITDLLQVVSAVAVPLLREGIPIGVLTVGRRETGYLPERQIAVLKAFADQAVIAIENAELFHEMQAHKREVIESLAQQTATADVLKVISRSAFDLKPVLDALVALAARVCEADNCVIFRQEGELFRFAAHFGFSKEFEEYGRTHPHQLGRGSLTGRVAAEGRTIHVRDVLADPEYGATGYQQLGDYRTVLGVPLLREGLPIGVFALSRSIVKPFTERQIDLVQTFADQAVIAIESVRLFEEVQARTADLEEALQQQTATADVLKVISRSTFDLPAVLNALVHSAAALCNANYGGIFLRDGNVLRGRASISELPTDWEPDHPIEINRKWISGRVALSGEIEHIPDVLADDEYELAGLRQISETRALMGVPLLRDGKVDGVFFLGRPEPGAFTPRQSELVQTFADQAVIAIENARLFEALQNRTEELSRSLQDLHAAQDRLIQTEKLASLGQLTAGIAHEIKNPLNFVNNFSSLSADLLDELREVLGGASLGDKERKEVDELTEILKGNLNKVMLHGNRADTIVKNMLLHSRAGTGEHRPTNVNAVVEQSLNLAFHGARAERKNFNIALEREFDPEAGEVDIYPQEITRVLLNLVSNGFYATMKRAAEVNGVYDPVVSASTKSLGDRVEIRIRDNGTGISPDVSQSMFNPFFTTKPPGEGTGLGLSLSHDIIVKQHAGTIEFDTKLGEFTEFRIVLPRGAALLGKKGSVP